MYTKYLQLEILDTGAAAAEENMSQDGKLLAELNPGGPPILHLYDWLRPSATCGHFIDLKKHIHLEKAASISFARRPTGGGIVFHIWDLAFSFLMPANHPLCSQNTLENYQFVNQIVLEAVQEYLALQENPILIPAHAPAQGPHCDHFCMARPTIYDVVYQGFKIAGAAQRRTRLGYLHQGTISLTSPDLPLLKQILRSEEEITAAMASYTFAPIAPSQLKKARLELQELLKQKFLAKINPVS